MKSLRAPHLSCLLRYLFLFFAWVTPKLLFSEKEMRKRRRRENPPAKRCQAYRWNIVFRDEPRKCLPTAMIARVQGLYVSAMTMRTIVFQNFTQKRRSSVKEAHLREVSRFRSTSFLSLSLGLPFWKHRYTTHESSFHARSKDSWNRQFSTLDPLKLLVTWINDNFTEIMGKLGYKTAFLQ